MTVPAPKQVIMIDSASTTNAGSATGYVDTLGYDYAVIDIKMGTSDDATNNPSVFNLKESDTVTSATSMTNITAFVGDTAWTIPNAVTQGSWGVQFRVDLKGRKRYLGLQISPVTTQIVDATCNLFRGDAAVNTTTANVKALVSG